VFLRRAAIERGNTSFGNVKNVQIFTDSYTFQRPRNRWEDNIKKDLQEVGKGTGSSWLRIGQVAGTCECGNEPSGSIKCGEFLDWLRKV
jgi:hypothetical protein